MNKISILLPTRRRFEMCKKSMESLYQTCYSEDNFEILIAYDSDDIHTTNQLRDYFRNKTNIYYFEYERKHYRGLHHYINDLSLKAKGSSLFFWSDDCLVTSHHWDLEVLRAHNEGFYMLSPKVANMESYWRDCGVLFPIIPKKWVEITGVFSAIPANDSWIDVLSKKLNVYRLLESVVLIHDRFNESGNNYDENYIEARNDLQNSSYHTWDYNIVDEHYNKLKNYLDSINQ